MKLAFMGDTFLKTKDDTNPFAHVQPLLDQADIRVLNLETALAHKFHNFTVKKHIRLKCHFNDAIYLQDAGIDVLHLDNNHSKDCGKEGIDFAISSLKALGINSTMNGDNIAVKFIDDFQVGFIGCRLFEDDNDRLNRLLRQIEVALRFSGILVVSLHWGQEHMPVPSPWQIEAAHKIIDAGAKIVVGHHTHCPQGIERYNNGLIAYSLGNFNFWQDDVKMNWYNRIAPILIVNVEKDNIINYCTNYCKIDDNYVPIPVDPYTTEYDDLWNFEDDLSANIGAYTEKEWYNLLGYQYITQTIKSSMIAISRYGFNPLWRFIKWLCRPHTHKAFLGMIRKGKVDRWKQYGENLAP